MEMIPATIPKTVGSVAHAQGVDRRRPVGKTSIKMGSNPIGIVHKNCPLIARPSAVGRDPGSTRRPRTEYSSMNEVASMKRPIAERIQPTEFSALRYQTNPPTSEKSSHTSVFNRAASRQ